MNAMINRQLIFLVFIFSAITSFAQDSTFQFEVLNRGKKRIVIGWTNPFETCIQLNIQRSADSLSNFRTIYAAASPHLKTNGFTDVNAPDSNQFYRIFYVLQGGAYYFTEAKRAITNSKKTVEIQDDLITENPIVQPKPEKTKVYISVINRQDSLLTRFEDRFYKKFKDSIIYRTKDTLFNLNDTLVKLHTFIPLEVWKPSKYIFTNKLGYIEINLPDFEIKKYCIIFYDDEYQNVLFEIKHIKDEVLILDKANFLHAGWFYFKLMEDDVLIEKNKFYLQKEF